MSALIAQSEPELTSQRRMVEVSNLHKSYGTVEVLKGVDLRVDEGQVVCIIGRSGSGKSTLLRCLNLLERPSSGTVRVNARDITAAKPKQLPVLRRNIGMVFQHFELFPHRTALENVMEGPRVVLGVAKKEAAQHGMRLLEKVGMTHRADQYPSRLSGGEKQRVAIARALALNPQVMLFDEPTSALDPELKGEVLDIMLDLAREGMTMVVVTHEMAFARRVGSYLVFIDQGLVAEEGDPDLLLTRPGTDRLQRFLNLLEWGRTTQ